MNSITNRLRSVYRHLITEFKTINFMCYYVPLITAMAIVIAVMIFSVPPLTIAWYIIFTVSYIVFAFILQYLFGYFLGPVLYFFIYFVLSIIGVLLIYANTGRKWKRFNTYHNYCKRQP